MTISVRMSLYQKVVVRPNGKDTYEVLEEFKYKGVTVPKGYITNGADVPRIFWSFFPPNRPAYLPAVIIHDYLCELKQFKKADDYFELALKDLEVNKVSIVCMVSGVRSYHYVRYDLFGKL